MAIDRIKLYRYLVLDVDLSGIASFTFYTEMFTTTISLAATVGRLPVIVKLPGNAKGRYAKVSILPSSTMRLYAIELYGKRIGEVDETKWELSVPPAATPTSEIWTSEPLPIPVTSEEWRQESLPIPPTADAWITEKLPIPVTEEEWKLLTVPIPPSSDMQEWADLTMDA